jgi:sirohydrochlorin ferrochelatase
MRKSIAITVTFAAALAALLTGCGRALSARVTPAMRPTHPPTRTAAETTATGGPGLLLVAHGSPASAWNQPLLDLEKQVQRDFGKQPFHAVRLAFMEFTEPTVADGVRALEAAGCDRIIVVPLLIAPSSHSHSDVPALLGLYADEHVQAALREEGAEPIRSRLPMTVTPTLDHGELFEQVLLERVRALSDDPGNEALVVLAHGDEGFEPIWNSRMQRLVTYLCGTTGITYGDYAFAHVGQAYGLHGVPTVAAAAQHRKRVLVVGCYLSMGTTGMHQRFMHTPRSRAFPMPNPLEGKDVVTADAGLLPSPLVARWIIQTATQALN